MPIRIDKLLTKNEDDAIKLFVNIVELAKQPKEECFIGEFICKDNGIEHFAFNISDSITEEDVMKSIIYFKSGDNPKLVDIDVVINNDNMIEMDFIEKVHNNAKTSEIWSVEHEDAHAYVETVNRFIDDEKPINGKQKVSLSAIPYNLDDFLLIGKDIDDLNRLWGFKEQKYKWLGDEPVLLGVSEDFVSGECLVGEIINHRKVNLNISSNYYEAIIVQIKTGLGTIPFLFPIEYEDKLIDGYYIRTMATIKADFATNDNYFRNSIN